jgi:hypothetical protein
MTDTPYKFNLASAQKEIAQWKKLYCRKNSKLPCKISIRVSHGGDEVFWRYFLECFRVGERIHQTEITKEAHDYLTLDKNLNRSDFIGASFIELLYFQPLNTLPQ